VKLITLGALVWLLLIVPALSQTLPETTPAGLAKTVDGIVEIRQQTQSAKNEWATERAELRGRYRGACANVDYLASRKALLEQRVAALEERIAELRRRLEESGRLEVSLQDTLSAVLQRLERSVARDLPFLPDEREARLTSLRGELVRPDVDPAEKLRRLLEALQIEAQYGGTVEVYQDRIDVAGDSLFVDVLRLGRLSVFWRTPDGKRAGEYDRARGEWTDLARKHHRSIGQAMEMATRMRPVELITLPIGRIRQ
jgi:hypothetical protein